jgi:hypothetical protein
LGHQLTAGAGEECMRAARAGGGETEGNRVAVLESKAEPPHFGLCAEKPSCWSLVSRRSSKTSQTYATSAPKVRECKR